MFCKPSGNSSSWIPRGSLICYCCLGSFAISFKGTGMVIFPTTAPMSMSSLASFPFSFFLMFSCLAGSFFELALVGGSSYEEFQGETPWEGLTWAMSLL